MYSKTGKSIYKEKEELKTHKSSKINPNCISCHQPFGIFHDQLGFIGYSAHDLPIINSSQSIMRIPFIFNQCNHRICNQCLPENGLRTPEKMIIDDINSDNFVCCPECSNAHSKMNSRNKSIPYHFDQLEKDATLFMECCIAQFTRDQLHLEQRNNQINKKLNNEANHLKFKKLFSKFILNCDKCLNKTIENNDDTSSDFGHCYEIKNEANKFILNESSNATHYCACCKNWCCESCTKECKEATHEIFIIENIKNRNCELHSKLSNIYFKDDFICMECYVNLKSKPKNLLKYFLKDDDYKIALIEFKTKFERLLNKINDTISYINAQKSFVKVKDIRTFGSNKHEFEQMQFIVEKLIEIIGNLCQIDNEDTQNEMHLFVNLIEEKNSLRLLVEKNYRLLSQMCNDKYQFLTHYNNNKNIYNNLTSINQLKASSSTLNQFSREHSNYNTNPSRKKIYNNTQHNSNLFINCDVFLDQTNHMKCGYRKRNLSRNKNQIEYNSSNTETTFESEDYETSSTSSSDSSESLLKHGSIIKNFELRFDSPDEIWIKLIDKNSTLNLFTIDKMLKSWHASDKSKFEENDLLNIEPGQSVIYYSEKDKLLYRAKIININKTQDGQIDSFNLELIDYARYQLAKPCEIFKMKQEYGFETLKPLWLKCYLENLEPYKTTNSSSGKSLKWSRKIAELVTHWRSLASFKLKILSSKNEYFDICSYGVDFIIEYNDLNNEYMQQIIVYYHIGEITLREALVHHKLASFSTENQSFKEKCLELTKKLPKFIVMNDLNKGEELAATIIRFQDLDEFFLKRIYYDKDFQEASERVRMLMNHDYEKNGQFYQILKPIEGMPIAAKYQNDGWFRGKIVKIMPNNLHADVLFVDYAEINQINLTELKCLKREYFQEDITTFKCRLFGIEFTSQENKDKASDYIRETTQVLWSNSINDVNITVKNIINEEQDSFYPVKKIYQVVLRYFVNNKLTNINVILTKLGFAKCTDISIYDGEKEHVKQDKVKILKKEPTETQLEKEAKGLVDSIGKVFKTKPPNTILCKVTNAISPSEIWLQDIVDANSYSDFEFSLSQKCKDMKNNNLDWKLNDFCLMKINLTQPKFYRAKVVEIESNQRYTILCLDTGFYEKNVCKNNLYELSEELITKPLFKAKCCTLVGIKPAGTQKNEWSSKAQSYTANNLNDNKVYVEFLDSNDLTNQVCIYVEANSTRVKKNYDEEIEYVRFTEMLFSNGLAFLEEKKEQLDKLIANRSSNLIETHVDENNNKTNSED